MARITDHFGITDPVSFENVELTCDNLRFLDPHLMRTSGPGHSITAQAIDSIDTFFETIALAVMSGNPTERAHARTLLEQFTEPWETRLGMSRTGFYGHGGAADTGGLIWHELTTNLEALLEVGVLKHLEHLPVFVPNVGNDITSDITTRITFSALADYTADMMVRYPQLIADGTTIIDSQIWDSASRSWTTRDVCLPVPNGKPLLLVPKGWVGTNLTMNPTRFYETSLLSYGQHEQTAILPSGKILRPPKWSLKEQQDFKRGRDTHIKVTLRAYAAGDDLLEIFRTFVDNKLDEHGIA